MLKNLTVENYLSKLESDSPTPGGGSALALVLSTAISLIEMACNVTITKLNKKGLNTSTLQDTALKLHEKNLVAIELIDKDSAVFENILEKMRLPKETLEQQSFKSEALQQAYKLGAEVPLTIMQLAFECFEYAKIAEELSDKFVVSDAIIGKNLLITVIKNSVENVNVNTACIKDNDYVAQAEKRKNHSGTEISVS